MERCLYTSPCYYDHSVGEGGDCMNAFKALGALADLIAVVKFVCRV